MMSAKKMEDKLSKAAEVFIGRMRKTENDFVRYEEWVLVLNEILLFSFYLSF